MSLLNKPDSVLTHGGGSSKAITSTIKSTADHHVSSEDSLYAGSGVQDLPERHMSYDSTAPVAGVKPYYDKDSPYPRHVHSTDSKTPRGFLEVNNEEQHKAALGSGYWQDDPIDLTPEELKVKKEVVAEEVVN